ncbi:phenylalanine--tRNA ligase subunit beta [Gammaproteobacteria bacterium]|nr:phenylalanine--tRNA ligase subunit beta [Gammaproteobacteria bacterium]
MKIAYQHLLRFLVDKPSIEDLSTKLFQLGHEHEIEDSIFDMEFTPNRGDCLSLLGLARDLNVFYKTNLDVPIYKDGLAPLNLNFINQTMDKCPEISFLNIQINDQISEYKDYLNDYFRDLKINKNNFFTDVSNYVAYEMGQPTHSYDFSLIENDITLQESTSSYSFKTLLGKNIELEGTNLVFTSKGKVINLSGIVGGIDTSCSSNTKDALIECAYFRPDSIIGKAVKYNIHSEASHKFERGTDPSCHEKVLRRFIQIVKDHAEIYKLELYRNSSDELKETEVDFNLERVNKILGLNVRDEVYRDSLTKLGFKIDSTVKVPSYRSDILHQNDLAEELARVIGYDNIPVSNFKLDKISNKLNSSNEKKIKAFLIDHNFVEVINSPFCSVSKPNSVKVDNPLDSKREYIRTNLIDSLVENVIFNEKRQKDSIKFFEISDIYTSIEENLKYEKKLAIIISGRQGENYLEFSKKLNKEYLTQIFQKIGVNIDKYFINVNREQLDSKIKTPIFAIELLIDDLAEKLNEYLPVNEPTNNFIKYKAISDFPASYRDLSFSIKNSQKIEQAVKTLSAISSEIIKNSFMFDFYKNKKTNETKIGYRFIFQSNSRTLTDIEVNKETKRITDSILLIDSVSLPGN